MREQMNSALSEAAQRISKKTEIEQALTGLDCQIAELEKFLVPVREILIGPKSGGPPREPRGEPSGWLDACKFSIDSLVVRVQDCRSIAQDLHSELC